MKMFVLIPLLLAIAVACAPSRPIPPTPVDTRTEIERKVDLNIKANTARIEQLLTELAEAEKPVVPVDEKVIEQLNYTVSVKWVGPIQPVLQTIANAVGMRLKVIGNPKTPVLVDVDVTDEMVLEVLRNLGMQSGNLAQIIYSPETNVIELVYPKDVILSQAK